MKARPSKDLENLKWQMGHKGEQRHMWVEGCLEAWWAGLGAWIPLLEK